MAVKTINYLRKLFRDYYARSARKLVLPEDFYAREFAAQLWGMKSYVRHLSFSSRGTFEQWVVDKAPRHLYYSSAVYKHPAAQNMDEKGWVGADLIFDIDADHLPKCQSSIVEVVDEKVGVKASFAPAECVREAAWEAVKLFDVLVYELGFDKSRVYIEFSGHRGFHVTVRCKEIVECFEADSQVRKEILDYVRAESFDEQRVMQHVDSEVGRGRKRVKLFELPPSIRDAGVRGRIARIIRRMALRRGDSVVVRIVSSEPLEAAALYRRNRELFEEYLSIAFSEIRVEVDPQVTVDTKRLIRIPYSLHGKTGLPVIPLDVNRVDKFELSDDLSPFKRLGDVRVRALVSTPTIEVLSQRLKLEAGEEYKLPAPVAVYLLCKEVAVLAGETG
ncbi:DNA primase small subunit [Pyrolobus fumarii 1A]|uniref:DNA primase small subunit PriS n=1 Tax=Pyrolobus fumarii (strain DSM 11204 / 1A) TaxID=694429 RepID=G0EEU1_PYRF1|nr:DNA primase small subunit domain-containing protein [Pyrolobus fumarii]AEM38055.1 DNA primase small subunit [Pyrolobus fumarii 1A]